MASNALLFGALTGTTLLGSFVMDRDRTILGLRKGAKMFFSIVPPFLNILILISILLYLVPDEAILEFLGPASGSSGILVAAVVGSIALIPGFVSYPIAAALIGKGASYALVAVFMTTLMMVGVVTLPLEIKYFGKKAALARNSLAFIAAIAIGLLVGWLM